MIPKRFGLVGCSLFWMRWWQLRIELHPMEPDGETEVDIALYLQSHESKTVQFSFIYEAKPIDGSQKLYVFDDLGAWCRVPINVDTMVTMANKSSSRSGDYQPI